MDGHSISSLERRIVVRTPENLELTYELAGAGTRSAAYAIDLLFLWLGANIVSNVFLGFATTLSDELVPYALAIMGIISFTLFNIYFMVFELLWSGQTPGKRALGIRVVKTGGYSLRIVDSLVRNLMRAVDFLPAGYGVGLTSLLLTRNCQRLGDLVAGTLVVYQSQDTSTRSIIGGEDPETPLEQEQGLPLGAVPPEVLEVCDEFLRRIHELAPRYRQQYAGELLDLVERTSGLKPPRNQGAETFLAQLTRSTGRTAAES